MKILLHIVLTLFQVTTCREEFRDIPGHTMCMPDNVNATPNQWGVSETEKNDIVKQHNMLRGSIEPTATDLLTMVRVYTPLLLILWDTQCRLTDEEILHKVFLSVYVLRSNRAFRAFATLIAHSWSAYKNAHLPFQSKTWIIFIFISFMTQSQCFIFTPSYVAYCSIVLWCVSTNKNWITIWLMLYFPNIYLQMMNMQRCN